MGLPLTRDSVALGSQGPNVPQDTQLRVLPWPGDLGRSWSVRNLSLQILHGPATTHFPETVLGLAIPAPAPIGEAFPLSWLVEPGAPVLPAALTGGSNHSPSHLPEAQ